MRVIPSPSGRRPVCASEVYFIADTLRRDRSTEFALPHNIAKSEVCVLVYLREHGQFIKRHSTPQVAAKVLADVLESIRDLCSVPMSPMVKGAGNNNSNNNVAQFPGSSQQEDAAQQQQQQSENSPLISSRCVLSEEELIQLVDLGVATEVDLYKVVPDIDVRLGSEAKIKPLLTLLRQLKE